ncbi:serine/threonine-protein kinase [Runella sp.]|uniref:serine/threonine-protein kinase n=1 Tax=Runella sp. TaxID=1960881 RepID=UPI003D096E71
MTYDEFLKRYNFDTQDKQALLGAGGFASVYKAYDTVQKRHVAVKVAEVKHEKFNLQYEKQIVDELDSHKNIVRYGNCYRFQFMPVRYDFAILKFYEEGNLNDVINKYVLSPEQKYQIIEGILKGVAHLHQHHIIHRDMKPQNILMEREGNKWIPKLTDFGLSKLSDTNTRSVENSAIGLSIAYAAPEQIQNRDIRPNVDLWAVGVCAYHLMVGELPFDASRTMSQESWNLEISQRIVKGKIPDKINSVPEPYRTLIKKCLTPDNTKRVQKAEELLALLESAKPVVVEKEKQPVIEDDKTFRLDEPMLNVKELLDKGNERFQASFGLIGFAKEQALNEAIKWYSEVLKVDAQHAVARQQIEKCRAEMRKKDTPSKLLPIKRYATIAAAAVIILGGLYFWNWQRKGNEELKWVKTTFYSNNNDLTSLYPQIYTILEKYNGTVLMDDTTNNLIGLFYKNGWGGAMMDIDKAIDSYEKVDDIPWGSFNLGSVYYSGLGGKVKDYTKAAEYFEEAAEKGSKEAANYLGNIYWNGGFGVTTDYQKAKKYYEKGTSMGDMWAQYNLGQLYERGLGMTANKTSAAYYYELAAKQGLKEAQTALNRVNPSRPNYSYNRTRTSSRPAGNNNSQPNLTNEALNAINSLLRKR